MHNLSRFTYHVVITVHWWTLVQLWKISCFALIMRQRVSVQMLATLHLLLNIYEIRGMICRCVIADYRFLEDIERHTVHATAERDGWRHGWQNRQRVCPSLSLFVLVSQSTIKIRYFWKISRDCSGATACILTRLVFPFLSVLIVEWLWAFALSRWVAWYTLPHTTSTWLAQGVSAYLVSVASTYKVIEVCVHQRSRTSQCFFMQLFSVICIISHMMRPAPCMALHNS